jgi:hypothetical protein
MTEEIKKARDMDEAERAATLAALKRGPKPDPVPLPDGQKRAADMTERERQEWLAEHKRRHR